MDKRAMDKRAMDENSGEQSGQSQSWISTQAVGGVKVLPVTAGSHRIQIRISRKVCCGEWWFSRCLF